MSSSRLFASSLFAVLSLATAACSSGGGSTGTGTNPSGQDGTPGTKADGRKDSQQSDSSSSCCVNKVHYVCSSASAAERCADLDDSDTSGCTKQSTACPSTTSPTKPGTKDAGTTTDPSDPPPSGGKLGDECAGDNDCSSKICITKGNATFGLCSKVCSFGTDCPIGYDCSDVGNGSSKYCVPN